MDAVLRGTISRLVIYGRYQYLQNSTGDTGPWDGLRRSPDSKDHRIKL
jgi:hypothetical protein